MNPLISQDREYVIEVIQMKCGWGQKISTMGLKNKNRRMLVFIRQRYLLSVDIGKFDIEVLKTNGRK